VRAWPSHNAAAKVFLPDTDWRQEAELRTLGPGCKASNVLGIKFARRRASSGYRVASRFAARRTPPSRGSGFAACAGFHRGHVFAGLVEPGTWFAKDLVRKSVFFRQVWFAKYWLAKSWFARLVHKAWFHPRLGIKLARGSSPSDADAELPASVRSGEARYALFRMDALPRHARTVVLPSHRRISCRVTVGS